MALVTLPSAGALAGDSPEQTYPSSSIPRVDRDLLLGFLADNSTLMLIDARSPEEFGEQHLPGAINVPLGAVNANLDLLPKNKTKPIVVYCRSGKRAGLLKDEDVLRIAPYNAAAHAALEQMHEAIVAGRDDAFTIHLRAFQAALDALTAEMEEHKAWTPNSD